MATKRNFGEITNYPEGSLFESRKDLSIARVHCPPISGISGCYKEGADSIVYQVDMKMMKILAIE